VTFDGQGGWDDVTVSGGPELTLSRGQALTSLSVASGASAGISDGSGAAAVTRNLQLANGAALDLHDSALVLDFAPGTTPDPIGSWNGSAYSGVAGLVASGRNGGSWNGNGVRSSAAAASTERLALGIADSANLFSSAGGSWHGVSVDASAVLLRFTYAGDATLDGRVDVDDYGRIDFNAGLGTAGWFNGDFNFDGKINVDDYGIIDFNVGIPTPPPPGGAPSTAAFTSSSTAMAAAAPSVTFWSQRPLREDKSRQADTSAVNELLR
jgi:hypothetical protein